MSDYDAEKRAFFEEARNDLVGPLAGVRVLEVTTTIAGPRCGSMFAYYGAEVVRVELARSPDVARLIPPMLPDTDPPESFSHASINSGKKSITLDLKRPEARDVFLKLAAKSDVIVENFKKGTMASMGLGYKDICKVKADIIYVSITGYGQYGPYSDQPGYDPGVQALTGLLWMNAADMDSMPIRVPIYIADELAGLHASIAALSALHHRDMTGEGQHVDVSLIDSLMDSCTGLHTMAAHGLPTRRTGNSVPYATPANLYRCKNGYVFAGVLLDSHWRILTSLLGRPELAEDKEYNNLRSRLGKRKEVEEMVQQWCAERTREEVAEEFSKNGLTATPVLTPAEAIEDPHVKAREAIETLEHPCGAEIKVTAAPAKFSRTPVKHRACAPLLGAHTDAVLEEAGIDEESRKELRENGVI